MTNRISSCGLCMSLASEDKGRQDELRCRWTSIGFQLGPGLQGSGVRGWQQIGEIEDVAVQEEELQRSWKHSVIELLSSSLVWPHFEETALTWELHGKRTVGLSERVCLAQVLVDRGFLRI